MFSDMISRDEVGIAWTDARFGRGGRRGKLIWLSVRMVGRLDTAKVR